MVTPINVLLRRLSLLLLAALVVACEGSDSDDDPQQYTAGDLVGTWLMSAQFTWRLEDPALAAEGAETMRTVVTIRSTDDGAVATVRNCYPGIAPQQITVENNAFEYQLFDTTVVFELVGEGVESPRIDLLTGNILLPGPANLQKIRGDAVIDGNSGDLALEGLAHLVQISKDIVRVTDATVAFEREAAIDLSLQCFTEIKQRSRLLVDVVEDRQHRVIAEGFEDDTVMAIDVVLDDNPDRSGALMEFSDLQRSVIMRNAEALPADLFVADGANLAFTLPMANDEETAVVTVRFSPEAGDSAASE